MDHNRKSTEKSIWITWENQRRNREVSKRIGATLYEWDHIDKIENRFKKYLFGLTKTADLLYKVKPKIVFCQNPSIVLSLFVSMLGRFFSFTVIVDAHNGGLFPLEGKCFLLNKISIFIQKIASFTIVTNPLLKHMVERNGGKALVLPDPIPDLPEVPNLSFKHLFNILFICSFDNDEPYENVFSAATKIDSHFHIFVTGNHKKQKINPSLLPRNIKLLGYISEYEYVQMLHSVDITIDLTDRENCLVCGAYESVAAEKPMILSDTKALRSFFYKGALYTDNSASSIAHAIQNGQKAHGRLVKEIRQLKTEKQTEWQIYKKNLEAMIFEEDKLRKPHNVMLA